MQEMENQMLSTSNTQKDDSQEIVKTFADVLRLHGLEKLEMDPGMEEWAVGSTNRIIQDRGMDWFQENKTYLANELERLSEF